MESGIDDIEITYTVHEGGGKSSWMFPPTEIGPFTLEISAGVARFHFNCPLSGYDDAEHRLGEFLSSWEGDMLLQTGQQRREFRLRTIRAPGHGTRGAYSDLPGAVGGPRAEANTRRLSPWRRHRYYDNPLLAALIERYEGYRRYREQLSVVSYLCLSALQQSFDGRRGLSHALAIERPVIDRFGTLVSVVGTIASARKIASNHEFRALTPAEHFWVEVVLRALIDRAGQAFDGVQPAPVLTDLNLPPL